MPPIRHCSARRVGYATPEFPENRILLTVVLRLLRRQGIGKAARGRYRVTTALPVRLGLDQSPQVILDADQVSCDVEAQ